MSYPEHSIGGGGGQVTILNTNNLNNCMISRIFNKLITDLFDLLMTDTTAVYQSRPETFGTERITPHSLELENSSLEIHSEYSFFMDFYNSARNAFGVFLALLIGKMH